MKQEEIQTLKNLHAGHDWVCADCGSNSELLLKAATEIEHLLLVNTELKSEILRFQAMNPYG
jgi:hypothetical protein